LTSKYFPVRLAGVEALSRDDATAADVGRLSAGLACLLFFARIWCSGGIGPLAAWNRSAAPPSSLQPAAEPVLVRITHRHRLVSKCSLSSAAMACQARELDGDSATTLRLARPGPVTTTVRNNVVRVSFPHHVGPQEQTVRLLPGDWLVDWPGAATIGRLHVATGASPGVALTTATGVCRLKEKRCELDAKRTQQITVLGGGG